VHENDNELQMITKKQWISVLGIYHILLEMPSVSRDFPRQ